jgi:delta 1-pyrroline-5-carboxylate dehydrogenase
MRSAFGFSGQKCSACSRVYVEREVYDPFMEKLIGKTKELVIGDGLDKETFVGPVIDETAVKRFEDAVALVEKAGGTVRTGGEHLSEGEYAKGTYVAPTVVDGLPLDHELFKRELFRPFVAVAPVDSLEQALDEANATEYGLTAGVFTEDPGEVDQFFGGIIAGGGYANRSGGSTTGAGPGCQSFCGWKGSGSSGKGGLGPFYVQQFLREQSQTRVVEADAAKPALSGEYRGEELARQEANARTRDRMGRRGSGVTVLAPGGSCPERVEPESRGVVRCPYPADDLEQVVDVERLDHHVYAHFVEMDAELGHLLDRRSAHDHRNAARGTIHLRGLQQLPP